MDAPSFKTEELERENESLRSRLRLLELEKAGLEAELALSRRQIEALKRKLFGSPQCESVSDAQLHLALAELGQETAEQAASEREVVGCSRRRRGSAAREPRLPEDVETVTVEIVPEEVKEDPGSYERVGEETTEEIDVVPMKLIRRLIVRPKFKRKGDIDAIPFLAPLPGRVVPGGIPSAGLVAHLIVSKYVDHLPLYRMEKALRQRFGASIPRQRMCDWIAYAAENWLSIIYRSIRNGLLGGDCLQVDETPIRYLDTDRKGKSHKGYLWAFGRPGGDLCFDWRLGRGRAGADAIASSFEGLLQSDGYAVYDAACSGKAIAQLGCWAHARRRFYEAYRDGEMEAARYLLPIRELYAAEAEAPDDPAERLELRRSRSLPVVERIEAMLESDADRYLARTGMADAVRYARGQWRKLREVFEHGEARIDNNLAEQAIRPTRLGMKNWLFVGSPNAGRATAMIFTILECCRRHGVEPTAYLKDVLEKLPSMMASEAEQLTPSNWKQSQVNTR